MTGPGPGPAPAGGLGALADLRVVELGVWVGAPAAGALLADWGADVIKVEPPAEQRRTGRGRVVEVSLLRTGADVLGWDLGIQMALGKMGPVSFSGVPAPAGAHVPAVGEHTDEVLAELAEPARRGG